MTTIMKDRRYEEISREPGTMPKLTITPERVTLKYPSDMLPVAVERFRAFSKAVAEDPLVKVQTKSLRGRIELDPNTFILRVVLSTETRRPSARIHLSVREGFPAKQVFYANEV